MVSTWYGLSAHGGSQGVGRAVNAQVVACAVALFVVAFLVLGYLGIEPTTVWGQFTVAEGSFMDRMLDTKDRATWMARLCTLIYFAFFILMPWYTAKDKVKPVPDRVTM